MVGLIAFVQHTAIIEGDSDAVATGLEVVLEQQLQKFRVRDCQFAITLCPCPVFFGWVVTGRLRVGGIYDGHAVKFDLLHLLRHRRVRPVDIDASNLDQSTTVVGDGHVHFLSRNGHPT